MVKKVKSVSRMHQRVMDAASEKALEPLGHRDKNNLWGQATQTYEIAAHGALEVAKLVEEKVRGAYEAGSIAPTAVKQVADLVNGISHDIQTHLVKLKEIHDSQPYKSGGALGEIELQTAFQIQTKYASEVSTASELIKRGGADLSRLLGDTSGGIEEAAQAAEDQIYQDPNVVHDAVIVSENNQEKPQ